VHRVLEALCVLNPGEEGLSVADFGNDLERPFPWSPYIG
jgi:hypothetical protein